MLALALLAHLVGVLLPISPQPSDPAVASLSLRFRERVVASSGLAISSTGSFFRDRDMVFWWRFADNFGANPSTPYMFNALPLLGCLLPSPIWGLGARDAVVLLARVPPPCEYWSLTVYAMFMPRQPPLPFASLGDSVNMMNVKQHDGLFAHVITANQRTYDLVEEALVASGLPASAINLAAVPSGLGLFDDVMHLVGQVRLGTYFEALARLYKFANQTEGDAYIHSHPPVFYLRAEHDEDEWLPASTSPGYRSRSHPESADEAPLAPAFEAHGRQVVQRIGEALRTSRTPTHTLANEVTFAALKFKGLECLQKRTKCLGDGPDAAYFAPNVHEDNDAMELLQLATKDEIHVVTLVHHRLQNTAIYGSIAMVKPWRPHLPTLSKTLMAVLGTSIGVTSLDFPHTASRFVTWVFTRNAAHCAQLMEGGVLPVVDGCSVVDEADVPHHGYLTYCERVYLNPKTGLGPEWDKLLPARLYHVQLHS